MRAVSWVIVAGPFLIMPLAAERAVAESASVLLGKWKLTNEQPTQPGSHCTKTALGFAPNMEAWIAEGQQVSANVLGYSMAGSDVRVTTATGGEDAYTVIDHDHIQFNQTYVVCTYTRAG